MPRTIPLINKGRKINYSNLPALHSSFPSAHHPLPSLCLIGPIHCYCLAWEKENSSDPAQAVIHQPYYLWQLLVSPHLPGKTEREVARRCLPFRLSIPSTAYTCFPGDSEHIWKVSFLSNQLPQHSEAWVSLGEPTNHHGPKAKNSSKVAHSESAILQLTCKMEPGGPVQSMVCICWKPTMSQAMLAAFHQWKIVRLCPFPLQNNFW